LIPFKDSDKSRGAPKLIHCKEPVSGSGELLLKGLIADNIFLPGCALFRRSMYVDVGEFSEELQGNEDWHFYYRAVLLGKAFCHDNRSGTRLLARDHHNNTSKNRYKMLTNIIKARKALVEETAKLLMQENAAFSRSFLDHACKLHKAFLNRDGARLHLFYNSLFKGVVHMFRHGYYSRNPFFALYDGAYWIKERVKRKKG